MTSKTLIDPQLSSVPSTLVDLLRRRALLEPQRPAYTYLADGESAATELTYGELDQKAQAIGALLQQLGAKGERALLLYPSGMEFVAAFFGCSYGGMIAVPAYPPDPARLGRTLPRFQAIAKNAEPLVALTTTSLLPLWEELVSQNPGLKRIRWLATDSLADERTGGWTYPDINSDSIAFLQYTSGSTSEPKGVMVSHGNLLHNEQMIKAAFRHTEESTFVGWLPLYHDMGLIGNLIQPLYIGARSILMSPMAFLQQPVRWLQAISHYQAATSGGPNFAYDLCVRKIADQQKAGLDLSSWRVAFNGAEPVRSATLNAFAKAFASCGFRREAFSPCYGLAEATLIVSGGTDKSASVVFTIDRESLEENRVLAMPPDEHGGCALVSCGKSLPGEQIIVVDPESLARCSPHHVGEIWVASPSVAPGYWNNPEETEKTFGAYLSDDGSGPFLRTGDLGFLKDNELFVTGRLKDLIIIRGRNHYPQDIELTVERSHAALRPGCGAAFSIDADGEERLVLVQEIDREQQNIEDIIDQIRQAVAERHELQPHAIVLIKAGSIPKTSSGKIQRHRGRLMFLKGSLDVLAESQAGSAATGKRRGSTSPSSFQSAEAIRHWLASELALRLNMEISHIDSHLPLTRYGLDSLISIEFAHAIEASSGISLPMTSFLQGSSLAQIAEEILTQFKAANFGATTAPVALQGVDEYPLSHGQQGLWFIHQLAPDSTAYSIAYAVRIRSALHVAALRRVLQVLVNRHRCLRTTFADCDGHLVQQVHQQAEVGFRQEDASAWGESFLNDRLTEEAHRPFNLEQGPLLRFSLFTRSTDEHVLLMNIHHIIADFWSLAVLMRELGILYEAETKGADMPLDPLPLEFADYVRWEAEWLASPQGERLWQYWQKTLGDKLPVLDLPTDRPRPPVQTYRGACHLFRLSAELTQALKAYSAARNATLYMTLLAGFQTLLYRCTSQGDFLVGFPTAGRVRAEFAGLVGYFVSPVALRAELSASLSFEELLDRVRQTVLEAFDHQPYPLALLIKRLQPMRDPSRSPLFQVEFVLQKAPFASAPTLAALAVGEAGARLDLNGLQLESIALERRVAQVDLTMRIAESDKQLVISLEYNSDLFDASTVVRMAGHFRCLLESATANSEQKLLRLTLLTEAERNQILIEWNGRQADIRQSQCIHELFESQAEDRPEALAVVSEQQQLTYLELNHRANQLAHALRRLGVGPEALTGICLDRSINMIVAILAVLKAGGAYLPLDPAYPKHRLAFMLEDSQAATLITEQGLLDRFDHRPPQVICLDADTDRINRQSTENLKAGVVPDHAAYIIYTSGSTGSPKGVLVSHNNVTRLFAATAPRFHFDEKDVWTLFHSFAFDFSVWEMWGALLYGGRLVIVPYWVSRRPEAFYELLCREQVTILNQTPSAFRQLSQVAQSTMAGSQLRLRQVIFGGEALEPQSVAGWARNYSETQLVNMYGITETTVHVTHRRLRSEEISQCRGSVIGRPLADLQIYLLDGNQQPVPVGVAGEMYVGGAGLARGYHNRAELTAERMVPDGFGKSGGGRLYRSGDLARYKADGDIEYLGRIDKQVKVRGFRIEPGEIESALRQYGGVSEAVVVTREDAPGEKRLIGYLVTQPDWHLSVSELRNHLKAKLPEYMIPAAFVRVEALPLTANGKLDWRALPRPDQITAEMLKGYVAPHSAVEKALAGIWGEVLGIERIGIHDDFFELGGHSLLATRLISRLRDAFEIELSLKSLFKAPTVAGFAATVLEKRPDRVMIEQTAELLLNVVLLSDEEVESMLGDETS
jgi:amino acid adenylation domain-containing protein